MESFGRDRRRVLLPVGFHVGSELLDGAAPVEAIELDLLDWTTQPDAELPIRLIAIECCRTEQRTGVGHSQHEWSTCGPLA